MTKKCTDNAKEHIDKRYWKVSVKNLFIYTSLNTYLYRQTNKNGTKWNLFVKTIIDLASELNLNSIIYMTILSNYFLKNLRHLDIHTCSLLQYKTCLIPIENYWCSSKVLFCHPIDMYRVFILHCFLRLYYRGCAKLTKQFINYYFIGMDVIEYLTYNASSSVYAHTNINFLCQNLTLLYYYESLIFYYNLFSSFYSIILFTTKDQ